METIRQYAHLAAIIMLVVGPAWGLHPVFGLFVGYFAIAAWGLASPVTDFDIALGNTIFRVGKMLHRKARKTS